MSKSQDPVVTMVPTLKSGPATVVLRRSTAKAKRIHPNTFKAIRQNRARNWTKRGPTAIFSRPSGYRRVWESTERMMGPAKVLGTTDVHGAMNMRKEENAKGGGRNIYLSVYGWT